MTIDRNQLFTDILQVLPTSKASSAIDTAALTRDWMSGTLDEAIPRTTLDALCRQIDVRKRVSAEYLPDFKRCHPEVAASPAVVAGVAAAMLATAAQLGGSPRDDGFGLKCLNSALKALALAEGIPQAPQLRAWALELLDAHTARMTR